jgi:murein DD-endopeptidase MepM/ murein hydrolase activator NlpD
VTPAPAAPDYTQARPLPPAQGTEPAITATPPIGLPRRQAPAGLPAPQSGRYAFPVLGEVGFTDDYGDPRAGTGWHHGNDLFAPMGAPIVAVADGVLDRVGVNRLGGNRLWLTDDRGNAYYYAHLSAYAPDVADGVRVRAGQVIGFVGNTGQAITTPPHLHFEIHPSGGDSVNPYPYLLAWQRQTDVAQAFTVATEARGQVPAAGAILVGAEPERDEPLQADDGLAAAVR